MTKSIYRTDMKEMEAIRIKCEACRTVIELGNNMILLEMAAMW